MNRLQKSLSTCLLATALLAGASLSWAQVPVVSLGAASAFAVLGGTNVTCTAGAVVTGDIGVSPGSAVPFTNTGCTIAGATPPGTDAAAARARIAFLSAYTAIQSSGPCTQVLGTLGGQNLAPGVYCTDAVAKTGILTLTGPANGVWIFRVEGALTGTDFAVVMAGGGQPCNVFWAPGAAATMTTSAFKGNILAGDATGGSITLTGGSLADRALANVAVTMTGASIIGCGALSDPASCKGGDRDDDDTHDSDQHHHHPFGWKDERGDKRGHKGGGK